MKLMVTAVVLLAVVELIAIALTAATLASLRAVQEGDVRPPAQDPDVPGPGTVVREFTAVDLDGHPVTEADLAGIAISGFFAPSCPTCLRLAADLADAPPDEPLLAFVTGGHDDAGTARLVDRLSPLGRVCLIEEDGPVMRSFRVRTVPAAVRTQAGVVVAAGTRRDQIDVPHPVGAAGAAR